MGDFRVAIMQAEPYLTQSQMEWLINLTDKEGEGRLLPWTLLTRMNWDQASGTNAGHRGKLLVPPRPVAATRTPIAPNTKRSLVIAAVVARVRDRLFLAGPQLRLENVLHLFDVASSGVADRLILATLLGHLRLGISHTEADELVESLMEGRSCGYEGGVAIGSLYEKLQRAAEPEVEAPVIELREAAKQRLQGRGAAFASTARAIDYGDWLPEPEFRQCIFSAFSDDHLSEEEFEVFLLLAEKNAEGESRWRAFLNSYAGWQDTEPPTAFESAWAAPKAPVSPKNPRGQTNLRIERTDPSGTQQSWRSQKTGHTQSRSQVAPMTEKCEKVEEISSPTAKRGGVCRCFRRSKKIKDI